MTKPDHRLLLNMLSYRRPHESDMESDFVQKFIITPYAEIATLMGPMRNVVIMIGESDTLFSCHTDTVHSKDGFQEVKYDPHTEYAFKADKECLGADDTTGIWLMLHMIKNDVPGTYVFHRGEERGGIGSRWMKENEGEFLKRFKRAIAFDRKGETSVITKQRGRKCCSDEFAKTLAGLLGKEWEPDDTGVFTDTANYIAVIPECTNLSVGYYDQHTGDETQNIAFALELAERLCQIDFEALPTVREAKEEPYSYYSPMPIGRKYGLYAGMDDDFGGPYWRNQNPTGAGNSSVAGVRQPAPSAVSSTGKGKGKGKLNGATTPAIKIVKPADRDDIVHDLGIRAAGSRVSTSELSVFDEPVEDYDNLSDSDLRGLSLRELIAICRHDPYFAAIKIRDLLDENVSLEDTNRELNSLLLELDEECVQLQADADTHLEQYDDLQKRYDALDQKCLALERKPFPFLPNWRSNRQS